MEGLIFDGDFAERKRNGNAVANPLGLSVWGLVLNIEVMKKAQNRNAWRVRGEGP